MSGFRRSPIGIGTPPQVVLLVVRPPHRDLGLIIASGQQVQDHDLSRFSWCVQSARQCRRTITTSRSAASRSSTVGRFTSRPRNAPLTPSCDGPAPTISRSPRSPPASRVERSGASPAGRRRRPGIRRRRSAAGSAGPAPTSSMSGGTTDSAAGAVSSVAGAARDPERPRPRVRRRDRSLPMGLSCRVPYRRCRAGVLAVDRIYADGRLAASDGAAATGRARRRHPVRQGVRPRD
jgi:hypothetical protein